MSHPFSVRSCIAFSIIVNGLDTEAYALQCFRMFAIMGIVFLAPEDARLFSHKFKALLTSLQANGIFQGYVRFNVIIFLPFAFNGSSSFY